MLEPGASKQEIRDFYRARRKQIFNISGDQASRLIAQNFLTSLPGITTQTLVAGYMPMAGEVDPRPVMENLEATEVKLLLPVVKKKDAPLSFYPYRGGDALKKGMYGNDEPENRKKAATPDIILVPLVAFDNTGTRLGQGGGFYDRTLAAIRAKKDILAIGLAFHGQMHEALPKEPDDELLDAIVTEEGIFRFRAPGRPS